MTYRVKVMIIKSGEGCGEKHGSDPAQGTEVEMVGKHHTSQVANDYYITISDEVKQTEIIFLIVIYVIAKLAGSTTRSHSMQSYPNKESCTSNSINSSTPRV